MANAQTEHSKRLRAKSALIATNRARKTGAVKMYQVSGPADVIEAQKTFFVSMGAGTYADKIQNLIDFYVVNFQEK